MKIAVPSTLPTLDAHMGTRFCRNKYLLIIELETMEYEVMMNPVMALSGPAAGKLFAQQLLQENVRIVLSNHCNSSILKFLGSAGIQVIVGMSGSVRNAVKEFKEMCMADTLVIAVEALQN